MEGLDDTFIAMNGDVLTTLDYGELLRHHRAAGGMVTIATRERPIQIDYGVLHLRPTGDRVDRYIEKPERTSTVSMGIYVLEPEALEYIPPEGAFDFPDLVQALLRAGEPVSALRFDGLWFDIGRRDDYEQAVTTWLEATVKGNGNGNGHAHLNGGNGRGNASGVHQQSEARTQTHRAKEHHGTE